MGAQFSDYEFGFRYGERNAMDHTSYKEGNFNIATDTGSLSLDIDGKRIELTDIITGYTELEIRAIPIPTAKVYLANDTFNLLVFDFAGGKWRIASSEMVLHSEKAEQDGEGNNIVSTYETKLNADATETTLRGLISALQYRIDTINKFNIVFLNPGEGLPTEGEIFTIYFVPAENQSTLDDTSIGNNYVEYIWTGNEYEQIGLISTDLADYYKKSETYNKTEIDESFDELSYVENVTKSGNKVTVETNKNGTSNFEVGVMGISVGLGINTDNIIEDPDTGEEIDSKYINNTGTISLNLKNETLAPIETGERLYTENREYPVGLDANGYLSVNVPWTDTNTNTHYTSKTIVCDSSEDINNTSASNGNVHINHIENGEVRSSHNIKGTGGTTVTSNASGDIIINSTNEEITYNIVSEEAAGLCPQLPSDGGASKYLRQDGEWAAPPQADIVSSTIDGLCPQLPGDGEITKYLRQDGIWARLPIQNNLTSESVTDVLSAYQGKIIKESLDNKSNSDHTHTTSIATDNSNAYMALTANTVYRLSTGGTSYVFKTPVDTKYTAATAAPGKVATSSAKGSSTNYARQDHTHGIDLATGDSNGQVKIAGTNVSVKGLGTAAYTASTAYATSGHTHATSIATSSGTNQITLAASTKYAITAGGTSYVFTTPPNTTYSSKTAASGGTDVSLVTTGEKYTWNNKSNLAIGTTASTAAAGNHTHGLSLATDSGTSSITLSASTKYKLTAGGSTYIFTTPPNTTYTAATAAPGNISTSGAQGSSTNYARQDHTHGIALATGDSNGQVKIAGTNVSVKGLGTAAYTASTAYAAASHTHNYAGSSSAGGAATNAACARVAKDSKTLPGANKWVVEEFTAGTNYNLPSNHWYYIMSMQGGDTNYGAQLALGMTTSGTYYRVYNNKTWGNWVAFKTQADIDSAVAAAKVGTATAAQVLSGYTFTNSSTSGLSGSMAYIGSGTGPRNNEIGYYDPGDGNPYGYIHIPEGFYSSEGTNWAPEVRLTISQVSSLANSCGVGSTIHTGTYTLASSATGTTDLGEKHAYRYVNATNVYNKGKSDGAMSNSQLANRVSNATIVKENQELHAWLRKDNQGTNSDWYGGGGTETQTKTASYSLSSLGIGSSNLVLVSGIIVGKYYSDFNDNADPTFIVRPKSSWSYSVNSTTVTITANLYVEDSVWFAEPSQHRISYAQLEYNIYKL